eukprot:6640967-Karenia_brevis.AAC.1
MGPEGEETIPILVARDQKSGATMAMWVPSKGTSSSWVTRRICTWIDGLGYGRVILRSDQEASIKALQEDVKHMRHGETMLENSPVGESRSNGLSEKA